VAQPLALLMDEPLSNLDDELKDELCEQILDLHAQLAPAMPAQGRPIRTF